MDIKAKTAGKMASLNGGASGSKKIEAKTKAHQVSVGTKYDIRPMLDKLYQPL